MRSIIRTLPKLIKSISQRMKVAGSPSSEKPAAENSFFKLSAKDIHGHPFLFEKLRGKKTLIVNLASRCGYTYQYTQLQELHEKFGDQLNILGFPCNDFGEQEPGTEMEIMEFCQNNYSVAFRLFSKVSLTRGKLNEVYDWLTDSNKNGWNDELCSWNFCKYLVDEKGNLLKFYGSGIEPVSPDILDQITK